MLHSLTKRAMMIIVAKSGDDLILFRIYTTYIFIVLKLFSYIGDTILVYFSIIIIIFNAFIKKQMFN